MTQPMPNWTTFLHRLGRFVAEVPTEAGRPSVVVSVPCFDFASTLIASGIIASRFENTAPVVATPDQWRVHLGKAVWFPRRGSAGELRMNEGQLDSIEQYRGNDRLMVKWVENEKIIMSAAVPQRWLPLVTLMDDGRPELTRRKPGSTLARQVPGLEAVLGPTGFCDLVGLSHKEVCILDTKSRLTEEVQSSITLPCLGLDDHGSELLIRDLVRLDVEGGQAMAETYCCVVSPEPVGGFSSTIFAGSLRFARFWHECDSLVRVVLVSPAETNYTDGLSFANNLYTQRKHPDLVVPDDLLEVKPASMDLQCMYL